MAETLNGQEFSPLSEEIAESRADIGYFQTVSSCLKAIQRDYVLSEERTIKSIIEYKKALENITRQFEQACGIEEEKKWISLHNTVISSSRKL